MALMRKGLTKDETVRAMVTAKQKEAVQARAAAMGLTESEYLRYLINERFGGKLLELEKAAFAGRLFFYLKVFSTIKSLYCTNIFIA